MAGNRHAKQPRVGTQSRSYRWQEISTIEDVETHMVPATWTLDKYPNAPTLKPRAKVTILDQDGSGVVTLFHVSDYGYGDDSKLILRIWYDREDNPWTPVNRNALNGLPRRYRIRHKTLLYDPLLTRSQVA